MATLVEPSPALPSLSTHPYTCLSCSLAFSTSQAQRSHYVTDLHRYNSKRAVAGLAPVDVTTFNQKILERRQEVSLSNIDNLNRKCDPCGKSFGSEGAEKSHLASRKHKEVVERQTSRKKPMTEQEPQSQKDEVHQPGQGSSTLVPACQSDEKSPMDIDSGKKNGEAKIEFDSLVQARLDKAPQLSIHDCLFCPRSKSGPFPDLDATLSHMLLAHGFFLPDQKYLCDREGLFKYLAETITVWNVCVYCGAGFGGKIQSGDSPHDQGELAKKGLDRVRKHMCDKNHCKIAWDTEEQRLEYSDFFDYRSSYDDMETDAPKSIPRSRKSKVIMAEEDWEDISSDGETEDHEMDEDSDILPDSRATFGDSMFELVLPNGTRIGHRALRHIYRQNLLPYAVGSQSTQAGNRNINLITRLAVLANHEKSSANHQAMVNHLQASGKASLADAALIPSRGGGLNFNRTGGSQEVIKARNRGEAKEAGKHIRTFRDANRREQFKTRVGCTSGNNQKHYRDPLLQ